MTIKDERGVALVLALAVIALLVSLVVDFSYTMMVDLTLAANLRNEQMAFYVARSGVELARHTLQKDDSSYDALNEDWALLNEHPGFISDDDEGRFKLTIEDEAAKLPINDLINGDKVVPEKRDRMKRLFAVLELDPQLIDPIIDWIAPGNNPELFGAEDAYYQTLSPPYHCKHGPLSALEELLLVKGMTEEILYGTDEKKGLIHFLTLASEDSVNINTASAEVIQSLSDKIDKVLARAIIDYRQGEPFKEITDSTYDKIKSLPGMTQDIFNEISSQCGVKSSNFSVRAEGQVGGIKKVIYTMLKRDEDKGVQLTFWRVE